MKSSKRNPRKSAPRYNQGKAIIKRKMTREWGLGFCLVKKKKTRQGNDKRPEKKKTRKKGGGGGGFEKESIPDLLHEARRGKTKIKLGRGRGELLQWGKKKSGRPRGNAQE